MKNIEIILFISAGITGVVSGLHFLYFLSSIKKVNPKMKDTKIFAIMFHQHSSSSVRKELKAICDNSKMIDSYFMWRWVYTAIGVLIVVALIILSSKEATY